jgi:hypothetical protein
MTNKLSSSLLWLRHCPSTWLSTHSTLGVVREIPNCALLHTANCPLWSHVLPQAEGRKSVVSALLLLHHCLYSFSAAVPLKKSHTDYYYLN